MKRILVPVDGSDQSMEALEFALDEFPDSEITALTIVDPKELTYVTDSPVGTEPPAFQKRIDNVLEEATTTASEYDREVDTESRTGRPARVIVGYADQEEFDHIIMGSHGRSGLTRMLLGSVAEDVTRRASVPVTIVR
ncbi:MAG: universal stress protein [Halovenus sp.]